MWSSVISKPWRCEDGISYILGNLLLWYYIVLKCKGRFLLHTSFVANETSILLVCLRFEILSSQGLLTEKNFTQFIMNLAYHVDIVFILLWFLLCFISWKLYSRISWFCVPDYVFFYCRRWNISIKCIIYFDLWLFFCSNNYLCYIYKE